MVPGTNQKKFDTEEYRPVRNGTTSTTVACKNETRNYFKLTTKPIIEYISKEAGIALPATDLMLWAHSSPRRRQRPYHRVKHCAIRPPARRLKRGA